MYTEATWLGRSWKGGRSTSKSGQAAKAKSVAAMSNTSRASDRRASPGDSGDSASTTAAAYLGSTTSGRVLNRRGGRVDWRARARRLTYPSATGAPAMQPDDQRQSLDMLTRDPSRGDTRHGADYASYFLLLATAGFFLARLPLLAWRRFDPDEFQHVHDAWSVWKGMLPYQDFFEHHTPWYYYALAPFFRWFAVDVSFDSARQFLLLGRGLSLLLTVLSVALVIQLGRLWQDRRVGLVAGFLVVSQPVISHKTLEIRPDVLALPFFLGGLCLLLRGLKASTEATGGKPLRYFIAGGLALGAAIMCTQKMLFVLPGLLAGLGLWALLAGHVRRRVLLASVFLGGVLLPGLFTWAAFALQGGGGKFITNNFLLNAGWRPVVHQQLLRVLETSWPALLLALLGASVSVYRFFRREPRDWGGPGAPLHLARARRRDPRRARGAPPVLPDAAAHRLSVRGRGARLPRRPRPAAGPALAARTGDAAPGGAARSRPPGRLRNAQRRTARAAALCLRNARGRRTW